MSRRKAAIVVLVLSALLLAVGVGPRVTGVAQGLPAVQETHPSEGTISYAGRLSDGAWQPVADGEYDFAFALYNAETGGEALWSEVQEGIPVQAGAFSVKLGESRAMSPGLVQAHAQWLEVSVRAPDESDFTSVAPRQQLTAVSPPDSELSTMAASNGGACPHSHFGERWKGGDSDAGLIVDNRAGTGDGIRGYSGSGISNYGGVYGLNVASGPGVYGISKGGGPGVTGIGTSGYGVLARSDNSHSVYVPSSGASGVYVATAGTHGVDVASAAGSGVKVYSAGENGVHVNSAGWSGVYVASSGYDAIRVQTAGQDGLRFFEGIGRDYIRAGSDAHLDFRVENDGTVRARGYATFPDFAELMAAEAGASAYEPGDVMVISMSLDRAAALSSEPYSTLVLGVYSETPGFIGSPNPMEPQGDDEVPVAVVGIVPCKVSAENGAIHRGDLLVTSSTPGHAMRADDPPAGTILGKALASFDGGTGIIQVLVTLQ